MVTPTQTIPTPPFWGAKCIQSVPLGAIIPYINRTALYKVQWGFKSQGRSIAEYQAFCREQVDPILQRLYQSAQRDAILKPCVSYGYFSCTVDGERLSVYATSDSNECLGYFDLPRQQGKRGLCITDFFAKDKRDVIAMQVVTVGQGASDYARDLFAQDKYQDYLYWHGFNVETTEGLAEFIHKRIRAELGFGAEDARDIKALFKQHYRGSRYSFGYPACPNLEDQTLLLELLDADNIGVRLSDEYQLWPEESTSVIIVHHPEAKYFTV